MSRPSMAPPRVPSFAPPPMFGEDSHALRGARNIVTRCLCVTPGETVHVLTYKTDVFDRISRAVEEVDGKVVRVRLEPLVEESATLVQYATRLGPLLAGATATILLASERPPPALSLAIAKTTEAARARHLHCLEIDDRILGQSARADPDILATVNQRLMEALRPPAQLRITSDAGTNLDVRLALRFPLQATTGRPAAGTSENLPAGVVYTHPGRVHGTMVVDRAIVMTGGSIERATLRRAPAKIVFSNNRFAAIECEEEGTVVAVRSYLRSHVDAGKVGLLWFPTNYLVRSEIGLDQQDLLLPGVNVSLGFSSSSTTGAQHDAPVQMILLARRLSIESDGTRIIDAGRFAKTIVEGIDPFR